MKLTDSEIGALVKTKREESLMSQVDLAHHMRASGYKWSQATVWSVEAGERTLRLNEAVDIAEHCGFKAAEFLGSSFGKQQPALRGVEMSIKALQELAEKLR